MLAAYVARVGGDDPLANLAVGELPEPPLRPGWVSVRVEAASLNHHDLWTLRGVSARPVRPPQILGCDAAGTVAAHGEGVAEDTPPPGAPVLLHSVVSCGACPACRAGDELFCRRAGLLSEGDLQGTFATTVQVPAANCIPLPRGMTAVEASCLPTTYLTAYRMLFTRAAVRPGDCVLVQGASGGVATAAIQLAHAAGIATIATSRDEGKRAFARDLGAMAAIAPDGEALGAIKRLTGGVDAVLETVGEATWDLSVRALRPGGTIVVSGATTGDAPPAQLRRVFWRQLNILGSTMGTRAELSRLVSFCVHADVRPVVDRAVPLTRAADVFAALVAGERHGKLVITPS